MITAKFEPSSAIFTKTAAPFQKFKSQLMKLDKDLINASINMCECVCEYV